MNERTDSKADSKKLAIEAARLADAKKAEDIVVYDVSGSSSLADFVLVATVDNPVQLEAVEEGISTAFKKESRHAGHREGSRSRNWRVLDYGGVMIHLFERQAREGFSFDALYQRSAPVQWRKRSAPVKTAARPAKRTAGRRKPSGSKARPAKRPSGKRKR